MFLTQMHQFASDTFIHPPEPCKAFYDGWTLLDFKSQHPFTAIIKLGRARTFLIYIRLYTSDRRKS